MKEKKFLYVAKHDRDTRRIFPFNIYSTPTMNSYIKVKPHIIKKTLDNYIVFFLYHADYSFIIF